jgi:PIN domain nuclease of toxin-antitoxin system
MILLDTHVLLWLAVKPARLSKPATRAIKRAERAGGVAISSITLWEIAQLVDDRRVKVHGSTEAFLDSLCQSSELTVLVITAEIAALAFQFPPDFPRDPADRLIAATGRAHGIPLVTKDHPMQDCPLVDTVW